MVTKKKNPFGQNAGCAFRLIVPNYLSRPNSILQLLYVMYLTNPEANYVEQLSATIDIASEEQTGAPEEVVLVPDVRDIEEDIPDLLAPENIAQQPFVNIFASARAYLKQLLQQRGLDKEGVRKVLTQYNDFVKSEDFDPDFIKDDGKQFAWEMIAQDKPETAIHCDIVQRILSAAPSESSSERSIKDQKCIQTIYRTGADKIFVDSRKVLFSI